jgi:hypothetical protein
MAPLSLVVLVAALFASAGAQSPNASPNSTVWAAVAFVMYGERTPLKGPFASILTPTGAQQLLAQGSAFRARYLSGNQALNTTQNKITTRAPIQGIGRNAIDNGQLSVLANTDTHVAQGALAFMQGLYPPIISAFPDDVGGLNVSQSAITGAFTDYPLGGYQYPIVNTLSVLEETSVP